MSAGADGIEGGVDPGQQAYREAVVHHCAGDGILHCLVGDRVEFFARGPVVHAYLAAPRSNGFDKKLHRPLERSQRGVGAAALMRR